MNKIIQFKFFAKITLFATILVSLIVLFSANRAMAVSHNSIAILMQQKRVTLVMSNQSLKKILTEISKQTGIGFAINNEKDAPELSDLSIDVTNASVKEVLDKLLKNSSFGYEINDNVISILKLKGVTIQKATNQNDVKIRVSGRIIDAENNPLAGAMVIIDNSSEGAITDDRGLFSITAKDGAEIEISYVGYKTQIVKISKNNSANLVVKLEIESVNISDVLVTGIFRSSTKSYTGSATVISGKELKQYGNRNVLVSIRNIDPSLNIVENNKFGANPNNLPEIQIRGNSSLPNVNQLRDEERDKARTGMNTPLVIVDGFESTLQALIDMNENEIEVITILKDASATAIYGSRGANGVIVIGTKSPTSGKLRIYYRGDANIEIPDLTSYSLLNARQKLELEKAVGEFDHFDVETDLKGKMYYNKLLNDVNAGVDTYWLSKPLRVGVGHRHNVRLEGGDQVFRYSASVQYNNIAGVMKQSFRDNFNGNMNLSYRLKNIKFNNDLTIGLNSSSETPYGSFSNYAAMNPYYRTHDEKGNLIKFFGEDAHTAKRKVANPLHDAEMNTFNRNKSTSIRNNFSIEWSIIESVILRGRVGVTKSISRNDEFYPAEHSKFLNYGAENLFKKGEYNQSNGESYSIDASANLTYSKTFNNVHAIFSGVDYNIRQKNDESLRVIGQGYVNQDMDMLASALSYKEGTKPTGIESISRSVGITANFNYTYNNRYFIDLSARLDGNSAFGSENRFAPFWATGLGWNIHNEKFFSDSKYISNLKLRGSVGSTGSQQFSSYQALSTMRYFNDDRYWNWKGAYLVGLGNDRLKWQQKMNYNVGVDASFFNNRLSITFDAYKEVTKDLVSSITLPFANGFSSYIDNVGEVENKGFELKVSGLLVKNITKGITWNISAAIIHNNNKVVKISEALKKAQAGMESEKGENPNFLIREGYSENAIWVVPSLGIDPTTGKELYINRFGTPTFEWDARDIKASGLSIARYIGNINTTLRIKDFSFTASFGYHFGGEQYNSTLIEKVENANYLNNLDSRVYTDRWKKQDDRVQFKSIYETSRTYKTSRFVQKDNVFSCQNINVGYDINHEKIKKAIGIQLIHVSASVSDLFYISSIKRERGTSYPFSRQLSLSVNITF